MRKALSIFFSILLLFLLLPYSVYAENDTVSLSAPSNSVAFEDTITVTVTLSDETEGITADSLEITVSHSKTYFEFVSGKFLSLENSASPTVNGSSASISYVKPVTLKGNVFEFSLKGLQIHNLERTVRATVVAKNGDTLILDETAEIKIKVICKEHSFSDWSVDRAADCEISGEQHRKCSVCETEEKQEIAAYGHNFDDMVILRAATCTKIGYERGFCSRCERKLLQQIPATGHQMSEFVTEVPPGCVTKGLDVANCQNCEHSESRETEPIGHEFQEAVITTEPTISTNGVKTGYCTRCTDTTTADVPCAHTDSATGIRLDTVYGVFPEGTKVNIQNLTSGSDYDFVRKSLAHITNNFTCFTIETTHRGSKIHPDGEVTATFPIPEQYGKKADVFYISENGSVKKLKATLNEEGTLVTVKLVDTGKYAICKTGLMAGISGYSIFDGITPAKLITIVVIALLICWGLVVLKIIKMKNPSLYRRITRVLPTRSELKNFIKREFFVIKETSKTYIDKNFKKNKMKIKAVVFDLDHTLFDRYATFESILENEEAYTVFNREFGKENILKLWIELDKNYIHSKNPWPTIFDHFSEQNAVLPIFERDKFYKEIARLYRLVAIHYPDTLSTLTALESAGFKLGIITNGSPEIQNDKIKLLGIAKHFTEIIISGEHNTNKPDKLLFDIMADKLKLKPEEILFVGDHPLNDIEGARNAGYKTAWINATGSWALPEIERADYDINSLSELKDILGI